MSQKEYKTPGQDCECCAYSEVECSCGADWTDPMIYKQEKELTSLKAQLMLLTSELKITKQEISHLKEERIGLMERVYEIDSDENRELKNQILVLKNEIAILKHKNNHSHDFSPYDQTK